MPKGIHLKFNLPVDVDSFIMITSKFPHINLEIHAVNCYGKKDLDLEKLAKKLIAREPIDLTTLEEEYAYTEPSQWSQFIPISSRFAHVSSSIMPPPAAA